MKNKTKPNSGADWLEKALAAIHESKVTVFGDFCLDAYWMLDDDESELSVETGLPIRHVKTQGYTPGGAGNVAVNLIAMGAAEVRAVGMTGSDLFSGELRRLLSEQGIDISSLLSAPPPWQTSLFAKPHLAGEELNRMDFGTLNTTSDAQIDLLLKALDAAASKSSAVIINQQLPGSIVSPKSIAGINEIAARHPDVVFLADTRHYAKELSGMILKINAREAFEATGKKHSPDNPVLPSEARTIAAQLAEQRGVPVFVTRGEHGLVLADGERVADIPGIQNLGKTDPVGAGDTTVAGLAAVIGGGGDMETAARLANLAASITVSKLHTTGTASRTELEALGPFPDYIYEPELAANPRRARYLRDTEIEIIRERPAPRIRHAIFDHDGTLSTLREGWENIMAPMMMKAVLGPQMQIITDEAYRRVEEDVKIFIDRTTGIQTLAQMKGLIALVHEYGFVPTAEILDEHGYKAVYNEALLEMVNARIRKIERGELDARDFEVKGARELLEALHAAGVKLYLASGTDETDVQAEATVMGYAHLFDGGIHGAVGDLKVEAKRVVLERIFSSVGAAGDEVMVTGDGPVELREGKKRGALCLGVASHEICRYGLDETKRTRVIRAGADYVVPDFSQLKQLKPLLGI
jgi:rfaE bifunctional protein kinase chain/domain